MDILRVKSNGEWIGIPAITGPQGDDYVLVSAFIVDANGTKNNVSGYPKDFDSRSYNDDIAKARKRAEGDMSEQWGAMCKRDDRQIQTVTPTNVFGEILERKTMGAFSAPEPEEQGEQ